MARPRGSANAGTAERRAAMLDAIWRAMRDAGGRPLSWREMAAAAGAGPATLAHHFGKRDDVLAAILAAKRAEGAEPLSILATPSDPDPEVSLVAALDHMILGLERFDVGDLVALGLREGLYHPALGPRVVEDALEPILEGLAARIDAHVAAGQVAPGTDARAVAQMLAGPILMAHLHQSPLGGRATRPTDLVDLARRLVVALVPALRP